MAGSRVSGRLSREAVGTPVEERFPRKTSRPESGQIHRRTRHMLWCERSLTLLARWQPGALICRPQVLADLSVGRPGKSTKKAKKLPTCRFFGQISDLLQRSSVFRKFRLAKPAAWRYPHPPREAVCSIIWRFRPETTAKSKKKDATHGTHVDPSIILNKKDRKRG